MRKGACRCATAVYCKGLCKRCYVAMRYRVKNENRVRLRRAPGPPTCHPERKHMALGLCGACYQRRQTARHPERKRAQDTNWRKRNPEKARAGIRRWNLMRKFGISVEDYDVMLQGQGGLCALCGRSERALAKRLAVDHDHDTGAVRGLLCGPCNVVLGYIENTEWYPKALAYLRTHRQAGAA